MSELCLFADLPQMEVDNCDLVAAIPVHTSPGEDCSD